MSNGSLTEKARRVYAFQQPDHKVGLEVIFSIACVHVPTSAVLFWAQWLRFTLSSGDCSRCTQRCDADVSWLIYGSCTVPLPYQDWLMHKHAHSNRCGAGLEPNVITGVRAVSLAVTRFSLFLATCSGPARRRQQSSDSFCAPSVLVRKCVLVRGCEDNVVATPALMCQ